MTDYLYHHGIKGMKWGVRRFQNEDGSYTQEGKRRYSQEQFTRDKRLYGTRGAKRIQKDVTERGNYVSGARSVEAKRLHDTRQRARTGRNVGSVVGLGVGAVAGTALGVKLSGSGADSQTVATMTTLGISIFGSLGYALGRQAGQDFTMLAGGYRRDMYQ